MVASGCSVARPARTLYAALSDELVGQPTLARALLRQWGCRLRHLVGGHVALTRLSPVLPLPCNGEAPIDSAGRRLLLPRTAYRKPSKWRSRSIVEPTPLPRS